MERTLTDEESQELFDSIQHLLWRLSDDNLSLRPFIGYEAYNRLMAHLEYAIANANHALPLLLAQHEQDRKRVGELEAALKAELRNHCGWCTADPFPRVFESGDWVHQCVDSEGEAFTRPCTATHLWDILKPTDPTFGRMSPDATTPTQRRIDGDGGD